MQVFHNIFLAEDQTGSRYFHKYPKKGNTLNFLLKWQFDSDVYL